MPPIVPAPRRTTTPSIGGPQAGRNGGGNAGVGGRKHNNANHLLNFSLPARQEVAPPPRRSRRTGGGEGARWTLYNKEKFVNASFSFMLNPKGDYTAYFADSDIFFHWPDILQILVPGGGDVSTSSSQVTGSELPNCPICLSDPVAPRMTKCGHVYCYSCVLQYLALSDSKSARCPICNDTFHSKDLKSVRALSSVVSSSLSHTHSQIHTSPSTSPSASTHITSASADLPRQHLRLIQRPHNTTLALPQSATWPSAAIPPHEAPFHFLPDVTTFSRFMLASPDYILAELARDQLDLEREKIIQLRAGESELGVSFLEGARQKVAEMTERLDIEIGAEDGLVWRAVRDVKEVVAKAEERYRLKASRERDRLERMDLARDDASQLVPTPEPDTNGVPAPLGSDSLFPDASVAPIPLPPPRDLFNNQAHSMSAPSLPTFVKASTSPNSSTLSTSPPKPHLPVKPRLPPSSLPGLSNEPSFFFYQSVDGRHIYLHPLDIRVLHAEYKSYAAFPKILEVGVEGTEEGTMNDDLRKRCKYLAHLPTGCAILFIQVDLTAHVSPATLSAFETPLRQRRQRRKEKGKREERERRKAEDREREEEETQRRNLTADNFPSSWGHSLPALGGHDDFEDALARSLWDANPLSDGEEVLDNGHRRPATAPPPMTTATSIWSSRSFAPAVSHSQRSAEEEEEVAALWKHFETQQMLDTGRGSSRVIEGESSTGSAGGAASAGGKKKKGRGQKLVLTGGGRGAG